MSNKNYYQSAFFTAPRRIINLPKITVAQIKFYETIYQFWEHDKPCFLSNKMIKERTGISSSSTIQKCFEFFEKHGEIKKEIIDGRRYLSRPDSKIEYRIVDNPKKHLPPPLARTRDLSRQSETPPLASASRTPILNNINIKKKNLKICANGKKIEHTYQNSCANAQDSCANAQDSCATTVAQDLFNIFWSIYPIKRNKKRSLEIWIKQKLYEKSEEILKDVEQRILNDSAWKAEKYIPHPSTYLGFERWDDEITVTVIQKERKFNAFEQGIANLKKTLSDKEKGIYR